MQCVVYVTLRFAGLLLLVQLINTIREKWRSNLHSRNYSWYYIIWGKCSNKISTTTNNSCPLIRNAWKLNYLVIIKLIKITFCIDSQFIECITPVYTWCLSIKLEWLLRRLPHRQCMLTHSIILLLMILCCKLSDCMPFYDILHM